VSREFHEWEDFCAELYDGDEAALAAERARTEAWISAFHLAEERRLPACACMAPTLPRSGD
jgi:hypothetical protein